MIAVEARLARLSFKRGSAGFCRDRRALSGQAVSAGSSYRMLYRTGQEAEDVVQDTFLRVYKNLMRYYESVEVLYLDYIGSPLTVIDRAAEAKTSVTHWMRTPVSMKVWMGNPMIPSDNRTPEERAVLSDTQRIIHQAIETLPAKYKSVMVLRYLQDMSLEENQRCA